MSFVNSYKSAGGVAAGTYALGFTPTVGNTVVVWAHLTASSNTLATATLGSGRSFAFHNSVTDSINNENMYCLSRVVQSGDSSSFTFTTSAGNLFFYVVEVSGVLTPEASGFEGAQLVTEASTASHSVTFSTANNNDFALICYRQGSTISPPPSALTAGYTFLANGRNGSDVFYNPDCGAAGSKTMTYTGGATGGNYRVYKFISAVTDPSVSTVTGTTVNEGTALRFTVTLSAATNRTTSYLPSFAGSTAVAGTDYDSNLSHTGGHATYSNSVTFDGTYMVVPNGVTTYTVDVPTVDNALDQADRTLILTVGGVASTGGLILDNDPFPNLTFSAGTENFGIVPIVATLDAVSGRDLTLNVSTVNGSKTAGVDFTGLTNVPVTILAGNLSATVSVTVL